MNGVNSGSGRLPPTSVLQVSCRRLTSQLGYTVMIALASAAILSGVGLSERIAADSANRELAELAREGGTIVVARDPTTSLDVNRCAQMEQRSDVESTGWATIGSQVLVEPSPGIPFRTAAMSPSMLPMLSSTVEFVGLKGPQLAVGASAANELGLHAGNVVKHPLGLMGISHVGDFSVRAPERDRWLITLATHAETSSECWIEFKDAVGPHHVAAVRLALNALTPEDAGVSTLLDDPTSRAAETARRFQQRPSRFAPPIATALLALLWGMRILAGRSEEALLTTLGWTTHDIRLDRITATALVTVPSALFAAALTVAIPTDAGSTGLGLAPLFLVASSTIILVAFIPISSRNPLHALKGG